MAIPHLSKTLVLNRYMLSLFGVNGFEAIAEHLRDSVLEGRDENNISKYYHQLTMRMLNSEKLTRDQLLQYDQNIISHTLRINDKRKEPIEWKYFQYLSLLFTEIYLDRYFGNRKGLLYELNEYLDRWNNPMDTSVPNESGFPFTPFENSDLNKLAFWNATGSGKTLLMHVNILQYEFWRKKHQFDGKNKILLVTPNEGLTQQHLQEFKASGIPANIFSKKSGSVFSGTEVEIIEISKLSDEDGDKTVNHQAFETNNLVLIDEGHRGVSGDAWKRRRDYLSSDGFAFEYSATFGQAVAAANNTRRKVLLDEYARNIIFDYSYKHFYKDGYGKDYHILNVPDDDNEVFIRKYLTGALLAFYQQKLIAIEHRNVTEAFNLEDPLWIFVGGTVTKTLSTSEKADIPKILHFYSEFIRDSRTSIDYLDQLLQSTDGVLDQSNRSIFKHFFEYVRKRSWGAGDLYQDILRKVFNTEIAGAHLYVDNLKGIDGELGIRVGDSEYFGVINIGADNKLYKLCQEHGLQGIEKDFSQSLFAKINESGSTINLLIGAKKFTEGWSSWRVSTMGLMNVGRSEGTQIIQLFGRGVRLKGYNWSLKRSGELDQYQRPEQKIPSELPYLETLNIFGIRSEYMQQFKTFLEEEGLPGNDGTFTTVQVPVLPNIKLDDEKLKILTVREGIDFKKDKTVTLVRPSEVPHVRVNLDWYPKVQILQTNNRQQRYSVEDSVSHKLDERHLAFVDWDRVYFEIQRFKYERSWYNLSIPKEVLPEIMQAHEWYDLYIPDDELRADSFSKVKRWEEIVIALLKGYIDRYYNAEKSHYLSMNMKTEILDPTHPNFFEYYEVAIEESQKRIIENVTKAAELLRNNTFDEDQNIAPDFTLFDFLQHLYKPLLYLDESRYQDVIKISQTFLNKGEMRFVHDIKEYFTNNATALKGKKLFLLRNQSRKGVGFFEAHGFYPDFLLWLVDGDRQNIAFVDPKGLRQVTGFDHPKMNFYKTIKEVIQPRIDDKDINLSSFIVSVTPYADVKHWEGGHTINQFNERNIYFREEQRGVYVQRILEGLMID